MCYTCESLLGGQGEEIDLGQEPCAADLEVAAMVRHYRWVRAGNHRYVVYEGRNRLMGGVVVVVDLTGGAENVIHVRRIGLLEIVRERLMRSDELD